MHLLIAIINEQEYVRDIVLELNNNGIHGATVIDSSGTARMITESSNAHIFGSLQYMISGGKKSNITMLTVLKDNQLEIAIQSIKNIIGDISQPGKGILFTIPIDRVEGGMF